jgi:hypothetical protein
LKYLSEVRGKSGTIARVVAYSIAENSKTPLITFEYEAYRGILAELNTHCMLCKNAESSRAVPVRNRVDRIIRGDYYIPIKWQSNVGGMVGGEELNAHVQLNGTSIQVTKEKAWREYACEAAIAALSFDQAGYAKQIAGRMLEPFITVKGVISGTEWDNFWHLRRDKHADPAIKELADCMWKAKTLVEEEMTFEFLQPGEWHTPYVFHTRDCSGRLLYLREEFNPKRYSKIYPFQTLSLDEALKTSSVACGQVSFRKLDTSEETVERIWERLMCGEAVHASVTQHQGSPMESYSYTRDWGSDAMNWFGPGKSHMDAEGHFWSAQFKHWVMFRKTIPNEVCKKYIPKEE